jgi:hypothetical protein
MLPQQLSYSPSNHAWNFSIKQLWDLQPKVHCYRRLKEASSPKSIKTSLPRRNKEVPLYNSGRSKRTSRPPEAKKDPLQQNPCTFDIIY